MWLFEAVDIAPVDVLSQKSITTHPLELLELLRELLHRLRVLLPHLLDLGLVGSRLLVQGLLQHCHLLLPLGPGREEYSDGGWGETGLPSVLCKGPRADLSIATSSSPCDLTSGESPNPPGPVISSAAKRGVCYLPRIFQGQPTNAQNTTVERIAK